MSERLAKKVLVIGWDAADWKVIQPLLDQGKMPALEQLINEGVMGNLATLYPGPNEGGHASYPKDMKYVPLRSC